MATFADKLKTLRQSADLSQQDLADRLEISKSAVSMYEQGKREPNFELLLKIAGIFQVSTDDLLGPFEINQDNLADLTLAAHLDTSDLSQDELEDVADYIRFLRSKRRL